MEAASEESAVAEPKTLAARIVRQVEFYFSDENLPSDKFMKQELKKSSKSAWPNTVALRTIASFKKMKKLSTDLDEIAAALREGSSSLLVSETDVDGARVGRIHPCVALEREADDLSAKLRTVDIMNVPPPATVESVTALCAPVGAVRVVTIEPGEARRAPTAKVEFEHPADAIAAVETLNDATANWRNAVRVTLAANMSLGEARKALSRGKAKASKATKAAAPSPEGGESGSGDADRCDNPVVAVTAPPPATSGFSLHAEVAPFTPSMSMTSVAADTAPNVALDLPVPPDDLSGAPVRKRGEICQLREGKYGFIRNQRKGKRRPASSENAWFSLIDAAGVDGGAEAAAALRVGDVVEYDSFTSDAGKPNGRHVAFVSRPPPGCLHSSHLLASAPPPHGSDPALSQLSQLSQLDLETTLEGEGSGAIPARPERLRLKPRGASAGGSQSHGPASSSSSGGTVQAGARTLAKGPATDGTLGFPVGWRNCDRRLADGGGDRGGDGGDGGDVADGSC